MNKYKPEIVQASTDKQYNDGLYWLANYDKETDGKGNLKFKIHDAKIIADSNLKTFEINGGDKENINFIKGSLEGIINPIKSDFILNKGEIDE